MPDASPLDRHLNPTDAAASARIAYSMRALGRENLPERITVAGRQYAHERTVKHDFIAATGFYLAGDGSRIVLKVGRTARFAGLPMTWLGRYSRGRELRFYRQLAGIPNVPAMLGTVGDTGFTHAFVPGRPLSKRLPVPDGFFDELQSLMAALHARDVAYVDTNKPENILLGDDGLPHLIDFQISCDLPMFGRHFLGRVILRRLQREDDYHILKHKRRIRPDELTDAERARADHKSWLIRLHRFFFFPYFFIRRRLFRKLRDTGRLAPEGSK